MVDASPFSSIAVIGGGAWGTALANLCAGNGAATTIWAREGEVVEAINKQNENTAFLPGVSLNKGVTATDNLSETGGHDAFLLAAPVQHSRAVISELARFAGETAPMAICSKGVETRTGLLMTEMVAEVAPRARLAVLSGPSFADDVARGLPTAVTLACADRDLGAKWVASVGAAHFRPYLSDDLTGAALGGAVKNVLAIAAGVVVGRKLGDSARAALIARGFAEFQRLGVALGAGAATMAGLSGLGDLILTASSPTSRNMSLGMALGEGKTLKAILAERRSVAEGVQTAPAVMALAKKAGVEMPVCGAVTGLVSGDKSVDEVIADLLSRPFTYEG
ncbi:MAG: NAD(P)H-dependent glycerol-3-phosphate dehydrogenase [Pseudomonadota bacterium]